MRDEEREEGDGGVEGEGRKGVVARIGMHLAPPHWGRREEVGVALSIGRDIPGQMMPVAHTPTDIGNRDPLWSTNFLTHARIYKFASPDKYIGKVARCKLGYSVYFLTEVHEFSNPCLDLQVRRCKQVDG